MDSIHFKPFADYEALSRATADHILKRLSEGFKLRLGLATGYSPKLAYHYVGRQLEKNPKWTELIEIIQLDEWLGVLPDEKASCHNYLQRHVVEPWKLKEKQIQLLDGTPHKAPSELIKLKKVLSDKPLDLCILGLGHNGHLALNEPGSMKSQTSRIVELHPGSTTHSMLSTHKEPVKKGMTIGLSEILDSNEILLLVTGHEKKQVFERFLNRTMLEQFPATALYDHSNWMCFADQSALT